MKNPSLKYLTPAIASVCLGLCLSANKASAQNQYFTTVANGGTYSWDGANWSTNGSAGNVPPYASTWVAGNFARFYNGSSDNYTVTANQAESMSGLFLNAGAAATLNINDAGGGTGSLSIVAGTSQASQNGFSWVTQGFLTGGGTVNVNVPISGSGGVEEESGGGNIDLFGNNSFTGGFLATSSSTFIGYNNNNSFGATSSQIGFDGTTFAIMNNTGSSSVNIANAVQTIGTTGVNFIGSSATMSGNWFLGGGSSAINIRNNGVSTIETLSGVLSGTSGTVTFSGANGGTILLSGVNTYTGATAIGVSGDTAMTLKLGIANAIAASKGVILAGGTLDPGGFNQTFGTLGLTANSVIDFEAGGATLDFADSHTQTWTSGDKLDIINWNASIDSIYFGDTSGALTAGQLGDIEFNGVSGDAELNSLGELIQVVPEPSTIALGLLGGLGVFLMRRKKA
jgi:PEP-CTERM motif